MGMICIFEYRGVVDVVLDTVVRKSRYFIFKLVVRSCLWLVRHTITAAETQN